MAGGRSTRRIATVLLGAVATVFLGAVAVVGIVVAGAWMAAYGPASADALAMEARLVALTAEPVPVATLRPQEDWDIVCRLDPYSTPAAFLPRYLGEPMPGTRYHPSNLYIDEDWNGLAFIHRASRTVHVLAMPNKKD